MKLIINYDLINEINKANTGIDFKRFAEKSGMYMGLIAAIDLSVAIITKEIDPSLITRGIFFATTVYGGTEVAVRKYNKQSADSKLNSLASSLTDINIYTDLDSIKQARLYKTKYKLVREDKTAIQQNKFIMLPTTGSLNADEVSLQQEHIIGSKEYVLSMGEPKKSESKVFQKVFARQI